MSRAQTIGRALVGVLLLLAALALQGAELFTHRHVHVVTGVYTGAMQVAALWLLFPDRAAAIVAGLTGAAKSLLPWRTGSAPKDGQ